jgi:hypothetical protein
MAKNDFSKALVLKKTGNALQSTTPPARPDLAAVQNALAKREETVAKNGNKGICFVIDATASRQACWIEAQKIQARMFDALKSYKDISVGVISYGGMKVSHLGWFQDAEKAKGKMANVVCVGGQTQIAESLKGAAAGEKDRPPSSVILVGDAFEEDFEDLKKVASLLKLRGIKVYAFLDGSDPAAAEAFRMVASMTGGVFKNFGDNVDLGLGDLAVAAAVYDTGGRAALQELAAAGNKGAKEMLSLTTGAAAAKPPQPKR